jgi:hypothetical protein
LDADFCRSSLSTGVYSIASSWVKLVERIFADITEKQIRRGVHRRLTRSLPVLA